VGKNVGGREGRGLLITSGVSRNLRNGHWGVHAVGFDSSGGDHRGWATL